MSLRQEVTPDHLLGRVTAAFWTIHFSLGPLGAALLTWAAGRFGVDDQPAWPAAQRAFSSARRPGHPDPAPRHGTRPTAAEA